jgi:hypothetical protein
MVYGAVVAKSGPIRLHPYYPLFRPVATPMPRAVWTRPLSMTCRSCSLLVFVSMEALDGA